MSLGTPRAGFHAVRIPLVDVAALDVLGTLRGASVPTDAPPALIAYAVARAADWSFAIVAAVFLLLSVPSRLARGRQPAPDTLRSWCADADH